jgi:hypothetical protein
MPGMDEIQALQVEVLRQWLDNHAEHCGVIVPPWPHGDCQCPMPEIIAALPSADVQELITKAGLAM